jgi:hypothetical protein
VNAKRCTRNFDSYYTNDTGLNGNTFSTGSQYFFVKEIEIFEITDSTTFQVNLLCLDCRNSENCETRITKTNGETSRTIIYPLTTKVNTRKEIKNSIIMLSFPVASQILTFCSSFSDWHLYLIAVRKYGPIDHASKPSWDDYSWIR